MKVYHHDFENWKDVSDAFGSYDANYKQTGIPEPEEVILASYHRDGYEGDAFVLYRDGDKFYTVEGSHCSYYGLEDQWEPEEYTLDLLIAALEKTGDGSWKQGGLMTSDIVAELKKRAPWRSSLN